MSPDPIAPPEPSTPDSPLVPAIGRRSLAELMPSVMAAVGAAPAQADRLDLPRAQHYVVALVDGLGHEVLQRAAGHGRFLAGLARQREPMTATTPSTTATSLTSLGTGVAPGRHGMAGYTFRPAAGQPVMNALAWTDGLDPHTFQPHPTTFERLLDEQVAVTRVLPARFEGSGLTESGLRGGDFRAMPDEHDLDRRTREVLGAVRRHDRGVVYVYERMLDHTGHAHGVASTDWTHVLEQTDQWLRSLAATLPPDTVLLVTGDHGMVDVPQQRQVLIEDHAELVSGLAAIGGEGRFRQLYTDDPGGVARRWQNFLGERAWVRTRGEATEQGWFGPMEDRVADRFGDVVVAAREDWAVMTRQAPGELSLVGMHGSLTPAEMLVPLIVVPGTGSDRGATTRRGGRRG